MAYLMSENRNRCPLRYVLGLPRDQEQRNSQEKLELGQGQKRKFVQFFARALSTFEMIAKGLLRHAEIPRDIKERKMPAGKFGHF